MTQAQVFSNFKYLTHVLLTTDTPGISKLSKIYSLSWLFGNLTIFKTSWSSIPFHPYPAFSSLFLSPYPILSMLWVDLKIKIKRCVMKREKWESVADFILSKQANAMYLHLHRWLSAQPSCRRPCCIVGGSRMPWSPCSAGWQTLRSWWPIRSPHRLSSKW